MTRGRSTRQPYCAALGVLLLTLGQVLGQAEDAPKPKTKPVLEIQLTESKDGLLLLDGKPFTGEVAKYHSNKNCAKRKD